ncbi:hypothetical protein [Nonomuraea fuscirosea]|uniref:hypothetical protein n=1 Tax=Nonomuraea fuscirosea TaxID=1291556 RepID=UPI00344A414B
MAEFFEVRTTIGGREQAAELAHGILFSGLATSIDIAEAPDPAPGREAAGWQLTFIAAGPQVAALERHIRQASPDTPVEAMPVTHDLDSYPGWLTDGQT